MRRKLTILIVVLIIAGLGTGAAALMLGKNDSFELDGGPAIVVESNQTDPKTSTATPESEPASTETASEETASPAPNGPKNGTPDGPQGNAETDTAPPNGTAGIAPAPAGPPAPAAVPQPQRAPKAPPAYVGNYDDDDDDDDNDDDNDDDDDD
ncbi:hypothetical protein ACU19_07500 [Actinobaculum suis]|uniref:hypothetical protein n=1 Tax=Actinobaculum suis TaxID=1657 RepID=UPI00066FEDF5|nr:hypothetical protein [Actinobaculum suis]KMY22851.1 hypothetical protein ACU19_07500 [Actinobaculum suis]